MLSRKRIRNSSPTRIAVSSRSISASKRRKPNESSPRAVAQGEPLPTGTRVNLSSDPRRPRTSIFFKKDRTVRSTFSSPIRASRRATRSAAASRCASPPARHHGGARTNSAARSPAVHPAPRSAAAQPHVNIGSCTVGRRYRRNREADFASDLEAVQKVWVRQCIAQARGGRTDILALLRRRYCHVTLPASTETFPIQQHVLRVGLPRRRRGVALHLCTHQLATLR